MTITFALKIFFEIAAVLLIAYGIMNEEKLVAFERELFPVLKFAFKKYVLGVNKAPRQEAKKNVCKEQMKTPSAHKNREHRAEIKVFPSRTNTIKGNVA